ncbi:Suppressor of Sensor Kinase (SLN1), partial [Coemansia sp. RSA 2704]
DCMANERRTFRWAMQALEFTMAAGKNNTLQVLGREDWQLMKAQVAGCVTLMISHFDVLGDRNGDLNVKGRQKRREQEIARMDEPNMLLSLDGIGANFRTHLMQRQRVEHSQRVDMLRDEFLGEDCRIGRVLEVTARPEDQTLRLLAASSSNITMRWQIGRYIGGGAFGSVYVGYNLDTGELMAVKEIRFPTRPMERTAGNRGDGQRNDSGNKIVREMEVMSMLQHPNIVSYYGIEVHREKVYLFMELCKSNLAQVVKDQGRLDERTTRVFVVQMLRGLQYLHESGICHRDIKCDNTLLDEYMTIKLVDFGAAKVLNQQSLAATRRTRRGKDGASLTGTPMYMAPEVILGSNGGSMGVAAGGRGGGSASVAGEVLRPGKLGAQDIWSLGCCIVEMVTGNPPWAHLDNEWAIMYHVVSGDPPLPGTADISSEGMRFIRRCFTRQPADRPSAADLLEDEWLAGTLRSMERLEARNQSASKMAATPIDYMSSIGHIGGDLDSEPGARSAHNSHRSELGASIGTSIGLDLGVGRRSASRMRSVSSISSAMPSPTRSRKSSMHTKNLSGDLRFMSSTASLSNAEVLLSMMDPSLNSGGVSGGRLRAYSGSDRSGSIAAASGNVEQWSLNRTPGSPSSANSLHAAWPFNKSGSPRSTPGVVSSPADGLPVSALAGAGLDISAVTAPPFNPLSISDSESLAVLNSASIGSLASRGSPEMLTATEEELVAKYTSTAVIYQALSSSATSPMRSHRSASTHTPGIPSSRLHHTSDMGSPADSTGSVDSIESTNVSQFAVDTVSDTGIPSAVPADLGDEDEATRSKSLPANNAQPTSYLTTDDIQELTETTRRAVSALLTIPLEGADVAGVSGWLGEGNTPMELLNADEIKETVVATSQNIVRQREQQLRQKQEMRSVLQRRQFKNMMSRKAADDVAAELSPLTTSGAQLLSAVGPQSAPIIDGFQRSGSGASDMLDSIPRTAAPAFAAQMTEPLALYPLPPDEDDSP